ncbi:MAG: CapA family protein, partial [bacterium]
MTQSVTLFLCGDVMTGRGIDQILPHPGNPALHETSTKNAKRYVSLAEQANGEIPSPVNFTYPWGFAREQLKRRNPEIRIGNLETAVTQNSKYENQKRVHYRMNPDNVPVLTKAGLDVCSLANNHVLDWGQKGFFETLTVLKESGISPVGAGKSLAEARKPAQVTTEHSRLLVFGVASN